MRIVRQNYQIITDIEEIETMPFQIERTGRTCYQSYDKQTFDGGEKFCKMLIKNGHESVLEHCNIGVKFITDRGVTHELVRHRLASFSQESTRYCNYSKSKFGNDLSFIEPVGIEDNYKYWAHSLLAAEEAYLKMIKNGASPQIARSVLPNSLKTEIVVTTNIRHWREIFRQRTSPAAHPQIRDLMNPLLDELIEIVPCLFEDLR